MYTVETAAGQVVASDTQKSIEAVDNAVMSLAHLCSSIVEVSRASRMPVTAAQGALANAGEGLAKLIGTRRDMGTATRELIKIRDASNLEAAAFGCPPLHEPTGIALDSAIARQAA